jgi:trans-aconitate 2-methyltransferase
MEHDEFIGETMSNKWNPEQYNKFKTQRTKPFYDLKKMIERKPINQAFDLGCGTGELTRILFDDLKPTTMTGLDSSAEMLFESEKFKTSGLNFQLTDITQYEPKEKIDLIFSCAALQWVPDHEQLFVKILDWVSDGGQVAIQMPMNTDHPSHVIASQVAIKMFPEIFNQPAQRWTLSIERYAEIFFENGFESQIARTEIYGHAMKSGHDVIEWTKGTLLTSYQSKLNEAQFEKYLQAYSDALLAEIGEGPYFYAFKRGLLWGKKSGAFTAPLLNQNKI